MARDHFIRPGIPRWLRLPLLRRTLARGDVDRELEFHLEERVRQFIAAGMTAEAARAEALRRFGDVEAARAELAASAVRIERQRTLGDRLQTLRDDMRYVLRGMRRAPGFALVVIATLALGIGASVTMFGVIDRLLLRGPDHVQEPGQLRRLYRTLQRPGAGAETYSALGYVAYARLRDEARRVEGVAAYSGRRLVLGSGLVSRSGSVAHDSPAWCSRRA